MIERWRWLQIIGPISGCHINPAVSLSMAAAGKISVVRAFAFTIVQCVGAICGAALLQVRWDSN